MLGLALAFRDNPEFNRAPTFFIISVSGTLVQYFKL
jgi:hypothetical protein